MDDEELKLCGEVGKDARAFVRKYMALRKDAERWQAMRELLVAVDWHYGEPPMSIAAFELRTGVVMAGPSGADAIADAAVQARIGAA